MGTLLSEMTLEELWELFPIILTGPRPQWNDWHKEEEALLRENLPGEKLLRISHVGSTAINGIWAKPIIDIPVEICPYSDMNRFIEPLALCGYRLMSRSGSRLSFNKGYTENGFAEKVFHLHLRQMGDHDELYFRDYLNKHSDIAKEYEQLKLSLWKEYEHNRDGYTLAKTVFVKEITAKAKDAYGDRYEQGNAAPAKRSGTI